MKPLAHSKLYHKAALQERSDCSAAPYSRSSRRLASFARGQDKRKISEPPNRSKTECVGCINLYTRTEPMTVSPKGIAVDVAGPGRSTAPRIWTKFGVKVAFLTRKYRTRF